MNGVVNVSEQLNFRGCPSQAVRLRLISPGKTCEELRRVSQSASSGQVFISDSSPKCKPGQALSYFKCQSSSRKVLPEVKRQGMT